MSLLQILFFVFIFAVFFVFMTLFVYQIYWPKHDDIGKILKVECTPILGETEYPSIFVISPPVSPGRLVLYPYR